MERIHARPKEGWYAVLLDRGVWRVLNDRCRTPVHFSSQHSSCDERRRQSGTGALAALLLLAHADAQVQFVCTRRNFRLLTIPEAQDMCEGRKPTPTVETPLPVVPLS
jgi:hypothetical protein